jgi:4-amino-4-deoxy-L-arabinose transferase-like glycosyltransferase
MAKEMAAMENDRSNLRSDIGVLLLIGLGVALFHVVTNGQYGFHRDELDIIMNARRLDWGYVAYPPLTPLLARIELVLFGSALTGMRLLPALAQGIVVVLVGLMARDMGGRRGAQALAALAVAISPVALTTGTLIQYMSFDYLWWVVVAFFTVRLLATDNPRWWLGIGAGIGLGMLTKFTMAYFVVGLAAGILLTPARRYLRSPWLWAGAGVSVLLYLPNLIWQAQHSFISLNFLGAIHARDIQWGRTSDFLPKQIYEEANLFTLPLWIAGLFWCFFALAGRRFRALGWMYVVTFVLLVVSRGRSYYLAPAYAMLLAGGAVWFEGWLAQRTPRIRRSVMGLVGVLLVLGAALAVTLAKPIAPINSALWDLTAAITDNFREMVGWQDMTGQVAKIYKAISESEKPHTAILAGNYGEAGALDLYGPASGLPRVISGANSLWTRGYGDPAPETVIVVGFDRPYAELFFKSCQPAGYVTNRYNVKNEETTWHTGLYVCRQPRQTWDAMWPTMQWFQ